MLIYLLINNNFIFNDKIHVPCIWRWKRISSHVGYWKKEMRGEFAHLPGALEVSRTVHCLLLACVFNWQVMGLIILKAKMPGN